MRLSDIKGEKAMDVIAELIVPIADMSADKEATELFKRKPLPEGMTASEFMAARIKNSLPLLLKNHKRELITILSVLNDKTYEEYEEGMNMASVLKDCLEIITDPIFSQLF